MNEPEVIYKDGDRVWPAIGVVYYLWRGVYSVAIDYGIVEVPEEDLDIYKQANKTIIERTHNDSDAPNPQQTRIFRNGIR